MVFGRGGIAIGKILRVKLTGLGEELRWLGDLHLLEFLDVDLEFRRVGRARGPVFGRLNII